MVDARESLAAYKYESQSISKTHLSKMFRRSSRELHIRGVHGQSEAQTTSGLELNKGTIQQLKIKAI